MFAYISELISWTVGASQYGVTEIMVSFNFTMYNRMNSSQVFAWPNHCEFAPYGTGILEVENLTFRNYYTCAEAILPITYFPGATNRSRNYCFCLSELGYTELPNGTYRFDIFDPQYPLPYFPTFGVTLILNETGSFRLYDEIPSSLFSPSSETDPSETDSANTPTSISQSDNSSTTPSITTVPNPTPGFVPLILVLGFMGILLIRRAICRYYSR